MKTTLTPKQKERRRRFKQIALWTGVGLTTYELFVALVIRRQRKRDVYNAAVERANQTQKQLVVVGSPDGGVVNRLVGRDYECGDLCVDDRGCPKCQVQAVATLDKVLPTFPDNSAVIFVSGTLEKVPDVEKVLAELQRVSGGDLYIAHVEPWTLTAFFTPGAKRRIKSAPPVSNHVTWSTLWWRKADPTQSFELKRLPTGAKQNRLPLPEIAP